MEKVQYRNMSQKKRIYWPNIPEFLIKPWKKHQLQLNTIGDLEVFFTNSTKFFFEVLRYLLHLRPGRLITIRFPEV